MSFTIPGALVANRGEQADVDTEDIEALVAGMAQTGVVTGCAVTSTGAANGSVSVAAGSIASNGIVAGVSAGTLGLAANGSGNPRFDLIVTNAAGTKSVVQGTAAALPAFPDIGTSVLLAAVYVPTGFATSSTIPAGDVIDKRVPVKAPAYVNVLDYGAVGNSSHSASGVGNDDTTAIQAAVDAARATGGLSEVVFPGGKTYRITATINMCTGTQLPVRLRGFGTKNASGSNVPVTVVWDGADGGVAFYYGTTGANIPGASVRDLCIRGTDAAGINSTTGLPQQGILFWPETGASGTPGAAGSTPGTNAGKLDSGSELINVWFQRIKGDGAASYVKGATNFKVEGGRVGDQVHGYGIYMRIASQTIMSVRDVTWDNWNAGATGPHGLGMLHLDAGAGDNTAVVYCELSTIHPETNADLIEANPTGTDPADRCGVIHCTVNPASSVLSHALTITNLTMQGGSTKTRSMVLVMGGTAAQNKARVAVSCRQIRGFTGAGTGATGEVIPIGNIPTANKSPYTSGPYVRIDFAPGGVGDTFSTEQPRIWVETPAGDITDT